MQDLETGHRAFAGERQIMRSGCTSAGSKAESDEPTSTRPASRLRSRKCCALMMLSCQRLCVVARDLIGGSSSAPLYSQQQREGADDARENQQA